MIGKKKQSRSETKDPKQIDPKTLSERTKESYIVGQHFTTHSPVYAPPKPSLGDRISSWDGHTEILSKIWYRLCGAVATGIGIVILVVFILSSDRDELFLRFVELVFSSGRGFTIPSSLLVIFGIQFVNRFLLREKTE